MKGISLDIAPTHSAVVTWQDEEMDDFSHTVIKTGKIVDMARWLTETICRYEILEHGVEWVAVEKSIYINNARNTINLGKLLGAIEITCDQLQIPFFEGTTAEIDSACSIPHSDRKTYTRSLAENWLRGAKLSEDECDAIAIGIWGFGKFKEYQMLKMLLTK
jgi:Holliday junction resolvasome RuvABC endonuclease subunit